MLKEKSVAWLERIILRGIEGLIADSYLVQLLKNTDGSMAEMYEYFESKYMAEQIYAQAKGWGL